MVLCPIILCVQLTAAGCSRWSRYLTDKNTNDPDNDDDDECLSLNASHASQPASNKYVRLAMFSLFISCHAIMLVY